MNAEAILALLSDLYSQVRALQAQMQAVTEERDQLSRAMTEMAKRGGPEVTE